VWLWLRESRAWWVGALGAVLLVSYGVIPTFQLANFGRVYALGMPGIGGAVDEQGRALPEWVGEFLRDPSRRDMLGKLQRSGAPERHAFVMVSFTGAPWAVESYLAGRLEHVPGQAPDLPPPVTGVWVVSGMGHKGVRWDGNRWWIFDIRGEGVAD
jgi:hypothetical protein